VVLTVEELGALLTDTTVRAVQACLTMLDVDHTVPEPSNGDGHLRTP
jgi:hypothetical protein